MLETIINNFHLERILWILKKRIAYMIIISAVGGILGGGFAYMTRSTVYRAAVSFYVYSNPDYVYDSSVNISSSEFNTAMNLVRSYILILKSDAVMEKVIQEAELDYTIPGLVGSISTEEVEQTAVFYVYAYASDPDKAMLIANTIGEVAPSEISRIVKSGGIEVVDYAKMPAAPYSSTNVLKFAIIGFAGGLVLSVFFFFLFGLLDATIRRRYELRLAFNLPILGDIPAMMPQSKDEEVDTVLCEESPFAFKESYNALRANMLFTGKGEKCPIYIITSAELNEGKTLNSINLAISYAQLGKKILLIDGDMRNSTVSERLKIKNKAGLSQYLAGLTKKPNITNIGQNLDVMVGGDVPPNPSELIGSEEMVRFLSEMKEIYDGIFIDMPPVGILSDALMLSKSATAYVMVMRANYSKLDKQKEAVSLLEQIGANICGIIFNGLDPKSQDYHYKPYQYDPEYEAHRRIPGRFKLFKRKNNRN